MTLTPAYGRDYKSKKEVQAALDADFDFILNDFSSPWDGKPVNQSQLRELRVGVVHVRYCKLRKIQPFVITAGKP